MSRGMLRVVFAVLVVVRRPRRRPAGGEHAGGRDRGRSPRSPSPPRSSRSPSTWSSSTRMASRSPISTGATSRCSRTGIARPSRASRCSRSRLPPPEEGAPEPERSRPAGPVPGLHQHRQGRAAGTHVRHRLRRRPPHPLHRRARQGRDHGVRGRRDGLRRPPDPGRSRVRGLVERPDARGPRGPGGGAQGAGAPLHPGHARGTACPSTRPCGSTTTATNDILNRVTRRYATYGVETVWEGDAHTREFGSEQDPYLTAKAADVYYQSVSRNHVTLGAIERALKSHGPAPGAQVADPGLGGLHLRPLPPRVPAHRHRLPPRQHRVVLPQQPGSRGDAVRAERGGPVPRCPRRTWASPSSPSPTRPPGARSRWPRTPADSRCATPTTSPPASSASATRPGPTTWSATTPPTSSAMASSGRSRSRSPGERASPSGPAGATTPRPRTGPTSPRRRRARTPSSRGPSTRRTRSRGSTSA